MAGFWDSDCPARGPVLHHSHWDQCKWESGHPGAEGIKHLPDQCCHCEERAGGGPHPQQQIPPPPPEQVEPVDVNARLIAMGLLPPPLRDTERDGVPVEPKMITGEGPQGRPSGIGRGELTLRQSRTVLANVEYRAWLAANGGGEEE